MSKFDDILEASEEGMGGEEAQEGSGSYAKLKLPEQGTVFMKIVNRNGDHLDLEPTDDDIVDSADSMSVPEHDCDEILTSHQFGQVKRFSKNGTGFSKNGRKLKHPRSQHIESFLNKEKEADDLLESEVNEATGSMSKLREMIKSEFPAAGDYAIEAAIYWYANHFHMGQGSPLYQVLSQTDYDPAPGTDGIEDEGEVANRIYNFLQQELETP
jgi:hypothetical protein